MIIELVVVIKPCVTHIILSKLIIEFYRMNQVCCCFWKSWTVWMEEPGPGCSLSRLYSFGKRVSAVCSPAVKQCSMGGKYIQWQVTHTGCDSDTGLVTASEAPVSWRLSSGWPGETDIGWSGDMGWCETCDAELPNPKSGGECNR